MRGLRTQVQVLLRLLIVWRWYVIFRIHIQQWGRMPPVVTDILLHVIHVMEIGWFMIVQIVKVDIHTVTKHFMFRKEHP